MSKHSDLKWIKISAIDDLPINLGKKTFRHDNIEIAVFRMASGKVHAIQNRCPHKQGVLAEGIVCDDHVFCPMHDRKIHLPSGLVQAPDTGCVEKYPVQINEGIVYIAFPVKKELAS